MNKITASRFTLPLIVFICLQLVLPTMGYSRGRTGKVPVRNRAAKTFVGPEVTSAQQQFTPQNLPGLVDTVEVLQDDLGNPHVFAQKNVDAFFMEGFLHARDRFFQMDTRRRMLEGTLAEILGPGDNNSILRSDSTARGSGLYLAAKDSLAKYKAETMGFLNAYASGVNAYLASNPLPEEYKGLNITKARPWTPLDSVYVGKALAVSLAFDLGDMDNTLAMKAYDDAGKANGFDGMALFAQDMYRSAPFAPTYVLPDANGKPTTADTPAAQVQREQAEAELKANYKDWSEYLNTTIKPSTYELAKNYMELARQCPLFANATRPKDDRNGSNWFLLSGKVTESGVPMITGDQHFDLENSPTWYQIQLNVSGKGESPLNVTGVSVAGAPGVALGFNDTMAWEATITVFDFTDIYQEEVQLQLGSNPLVIIHNGKKEDVVLRRETFRINKVTDGKADNLVDVPSGTVTDQFARVPFRGNGPIIALDTKAGVGLSVQQVGFAATQEIEAFLDIDRATNLKDFQKGLQKLGGASVNMGVVTTKGEVAYFTTGELPLRQDLEAGKVSGAPPFMIRDGRGGSDWQPLKNKQKFQTVTTEILPFKELPQVINPAAGFVVSANNDPTGDTADNNPLNTKRRKGKGIFYLSGGYASGLRAARLTREIQAAIASGKKISVEMARRFQASGKMRDAEILLPAIQTAMANAQKPGAPPALAAFAQDPRIQEAMTRFSKWDFTTPTGVREGYDSFATFGQDPSDTAISNSVSTTIYSMWRSAIVRNAIDAPLTKMGVVPVDGNFGQLAIAALGNLLDNFATRKGVGASGIAFFRTSVIPTASPEDQRDYILLQSLRQALDELAGNDFALAYNNSTNQNDYRWGKIHRLFIPHLLGQNFSFPSPNGNFRSPYPGLYGLPRDGGYEVPNACSHPIRAKTQDDFMFKHSPTHRFTAVMKTTGIEVVDALPGGESGDRNSMFYDNQLKLWLNADVRPLISDKTKLLQQQGTQVRLYLPASDKGSK